MNEGHKEAISLQAKCLESRFFLRLEVGLLSLEQYRQQTALGKTVESLSSLLELKSLGN